MPDASCIDSLRASHKCLCDLIITLFTHRVVVVVKRLVRVITGNWLVRVITGHCKDAVKSQLLLSTSWKSRRGTNIEQSCTACNGCKGPGILLCGCRVLCIVEPACSGMSISWDTRMLSQLSDGVQAPFPVLVTQKLKCGVVPIMASSDENMSMLTI